MTECPVRVIDLSDFLNIFFGENKRFRHRKDRHLFIYDQQKSVEYFQSFGSLKIKFSKNGMFFGLKMII